MLFSRKTQLSQRTYHDSILQDKYDEFQRAAHQLVETVEDVIVKKEVVALYPNCPDKKAAIRDLEQAQYAMICAIGHYDSTRSDVQRYYREHNKNDFYTNWSQIFPLKNSHTAIEKAYTNFFKK